jgi:hypothetical protein
MSNSIPVTKVVSPIRRNIATGLMLFAALGAVYAFITAIGVAMSAGAATQQVEWWRVFGFLLFTCIFVMLAIWPYQYPGLWEIVIVNKAALTIVEVLLIGGNAENALSTAVADGILTIILIAAYVLNKGYISWRRRAVNIH